MAFYKQSTAYTRMFKMIDSADHFSKKTGLTCTVNLSKAGAAFGAAGGTVTEVANGWYKIALTTTDTNTVGDLAFYITATGADDTDFVDQVWVRDLADLAFPATSGRSMVVDASGLVDANTVKIGPTGSGTAQTAKDVGGAVPSAAAGASGGLLISGSNTGTTTFGAITCTGILTVSNGIVVTVSSSNVSAIQATGNGTGSGIVATSGSGATGDGIQATAASTAGNGFACLGTTTGSGVKYTGGTTGHGALLTGGATSGDGLKATAATSGIGLNAIGVGTTMPGIKGTGGTTTSAGMNLVGGATSGDGLLISATSGHGINAAGTGTTKHGALLTGGATTSAGLACTGGATSGDGILISAPTSGHGINIAGGGTTKHGINSVGGATTSAGIAATGGGTSGAGILVRTTSGHGVDIAATGTSMHGITSTGGNGGTSDGIKAAAGTGGVDIRGNITGNLVGTVSTVTTVTNQLTAAAIATGIWQDTTAGDFTTALSVGKSIMNGVALGTGLTVNAVTGLTASNLDATISSRMATYTQPTGFLAATFPSGTVANTTNITAAAGVALTAAYDAAKTASQAGDAMTLTSAYDFAKGTVAMTESYAAQGATMTPAQAFYQITQHLGESSIVTTTKTLKKRDGSTTAKTYTLNDATTPTSITEAT